jgi:hypothetical protein
MFFFRLDFLHLGSGIGIFLKGFPEEPISVNDTGPPWSKPRGVDRVRLGKEDPETVFPKLHAKNMGIS